MRAVAFSQAQPTPEQAGLQTVLAAHRLPAAAWAAGHSGRSALQAHALAQELAAGEVGARPARIRLADFLPHVIGGLSGERRTALSSSGGFCVAHAGYDRDEAGLCQRADFLPSCAASARAAGAGRQRTTAFHNDVLMLIPSVSFVPFWVDGVDYCLVLGGELTNNIALVELIWSIKSAAFRFTAGIEPRPGLLPRVPDQSGRCQPPLRRRLHLPAQRHRIARLGGRRCIDPEHLHPFPRRTLPES